MLQLNELHFEWFQRKCDIVGIWKVKKNWDYTQIEFMNLNESLAKSLVSFIHLNGYKLQRHKLKMGSESCPFRVINYQYYIK